MRCKLDQWPKRGASTLAEPEIIVSGGKNNIKISSLSFLKVVHNNIIHINYITSHGTLLLVLEQQLDMPSSRFEQI